MITNYGYSLSATVGQPLWIGTSGNFATSPPTGTGDYARVVGYWIGGTYNQIWFDPDKTWIEIA